jgi:hypothetical protein
LGASGFTEARMATCIDPASSKPTGMKNRNSIWADFQGIITALIYLLAEELGSLRRSTSPAKYLQLRVFPFSSELHSSTLSEIDEPLGLQLTQEFCF